MKWLKRILLGVLALLLLVVLISFVLPKMSHVEREIVVGRTPDVVFGLVNDMTTYDKWMPWNQKDPNMKKVFGPTTSGNGAYYSWESTNPEVGVGKLTITQSTPSNLVATALDFGEMGISNGGWTLTPTPTGTKVVWHMDSNMDQGSFLMKVGGKWMSALGIMDKMIGPDFEAGLVSLKREAEATQP